MNVALRPELPLNLISLCTGGGGLDRAFELAVPGSRSVVCVEREGFSVASLVAQIEDGLMAPAAIWSDVRTFDGRPWRGRVDGLIGGIPCQPHSLAGRRGGSTDERDLWSPARRIIAQARPWFVLIENVGGFLSAGADEIPGARRVRRDLRKLGFQSTLVLCRADQMGLPHERLRAFILGVADWFVADAGDARAGGEPGDLRATSKPDSRRPEDGAEWDTGNGGSGVADAGGAGRKGSGPAGSGPRQCSTAERSGEFLGDATGQHDQGGGQRGPVRRAPGSRQLRRSGRPLVDAACDGRREGRPEPSVRSRRDAAAGDGGAVVHAFGGGRDGRPEGAVGQSLGRVAEQQHGALRDEQRLADGDRAEPTAQRRYPGEVRRLSEGEGRPEHGPALSGGGRPFLRPPGPGDVEAWRHVAFVAPGLLPAVSRYDRLRLEMGAQSFVADGDPSSGRQSRAKARKSRRGAGQGASHWVDPSSGDALRAPLLPAAVERALRGVADVMAPRIDELRMLGNGVADAQGALAVRIGVHDLAARGSSGAALLVRMMGEAA